jgi:hypothetical protein
MAVMGKAKALVLISLIGGGSYVASAPIKGLAAYFHDKRDCPVGVRIWDGAPWYTPVWVCQSITLAIGEPNAPVFEEQEFLSRYQTALPDVPAPLPAPAKPKQRQRKTFGDYHCKSDCSGHQAGYDWAERNEITDHADCHGKSRSFIEGCYVSVDDYLDSQ